MPVLFWITVGVGALWVVLFVKSLRDLARVPRLHPEGAPGREAGGGRLPTVSVIVPARDEERNIENCLRSLLSQSYDHLEIVVVDDQSSDSTAAIVQGMASKDSRVRLVQVGQLPSGWTGKCNAMHQGVCQGNITGEWLLFTDADTLHHPQSLAVAMQLARQTNVDLVTLIPHLEARTFWERLMQPTIGALIALFHKPRLVNDPDHPDVFANGQYMLIRREVYERIEGYASVCGKVLEDVELAREVVRAGGRMYLAVASDLFATRMYTNLKSLMEGWTKNFYMILESRLGRVLLAAGIALLLSLWPAAAGLASILGLITRSSFWPTSWMWAAVGIYGLVLVFQATLRGLNRWYPAYAPLAPLANLMAVFILLRSAWLHRRGRGVTWKGRAIFDDQGENK